MLVHDSCSWAGVAEVTTRPPTGLLRGFFQALLSQTEKKIAITYFFLLNPLLMSCETFPDVSY